MRVRVLVATRFHSGNLRPFAKHWYQRHGFLKRYLKKEAFDYETWRNKEFWRTWKAEKNSKPMPALQKFPYELNIYKMGG